MRLWLFKLRYHLKTHGSYIQPALSKASVWLAWNTFFGLGVLIPIGVFKGVFNPTSETYKKLSTEYIFDKIAEEGIIIFFCNAIMAACMIDYILSKVDYGKVFVSLMFVGLMMSFTLTCLVFGSIYLFPSININHDFLNWFQSNLAVYTIFYCLTLKTLMFYHEQYH